MLHGYFWDPRERPPQFAFLGAPSVEAPIELTWGVLCDIVVCVLIICLPSKLWRRSSQ